MTRAALVAHIESTGCRALDISPRDGPLAKVLINVRDPQSRQSTTLRDSGFSEAGVCNRACATFNRWLEGVRAPAAIREQ